ncbi:MAG: hypothetical protein AN484_23760 [Aphanizomenon flos-aquae WA102]|uniref:Uncharacterized protein n=1 Tax=Aphanizomenon flos-aquae WA102 TaxID=1710896 RepID=A0A1B7WPC5_APHFL|nr:MAG: hypothetical protein AN484_23760 [Aphanizomenon flos-aquae WA102]
MIFRCSGELAHAGLLDAGLGDEGGELLDLRGLEVRQRGADGSRAVADDRGAGLDDTDGVTGALIAELEVRQEEGVEQAVLRRMVVLRDGVVEIHRGLRDEVKHGGGVDRHAHGLVGRGVDFGGRQAAEVAEAVAHAAADRDHELDVAETVLVADEVRVVRGELL